MLHRQAWSFSPTAYDGGVGPLAWQEALIGLSAGLQAPPPAPGGDGEIAWKVARGGHGLVSFRGATCGGLIGFGRGQALQAGPLTITPGATSLDGFSVVLVNAVEGQRLGEKGRYLVTAASRWANRGMGWNKERTSLGREWGQGPSLCEGVPVELKAAARAGEVKVFALNPDGTRRDELPARQAGGETTFALGPASKTLWYELVIGD